MTKEEAEHLSALAGKIGLPIWFDLTKKRFTISAPIPAAKLDAIDAFGFALCGGGCIASRRVGKRLAETGVVVACCVPEDVDAWLADIVLGRGGE